MCPYCQVDKGCWCGREKRPLGFLTPLSQRREQPTSVREEAAFAGSPSEGTAERLLPATPLKGVPTICFAHCRHSTPDTLGEKRNKAAMCALLKPDHIGLVATLTTF